MTFGPCSSQVAAAVTDTKERDENELPPQESHVYWRIVEIHNPRLGLMHVKLCHQTWCERECLIDFLASLRMVALDLDSTHFSSLSNRMLAFCLDVVRTMTRCHVFEAETTVA